MLSCSVLVASVLAGPPVGGTGALATTGESLGDAIVTGVETHPEFERYALRQPDGRVAIAEVTTGAGGLCERGGLTVFPRPDLSDGVTGTVGMDVLCERLDARAPDLRPRIGPDGDAGGGDVPGPDGAPVTHEASPGAREIRAERRVGPLHVVLLALAVLCVTRARPDRMVVGVGLVALVARLLLSPRGVANGNLAGYEKLVLARGTVENPLYGDAWGALMGAVPGWPDGVFAANLVLASASAALLAAVTRALAGPAAGLAAGLFLAFLPTHVGVSATETMHVPVLFFTLVSALGALAWSRGGALADGMVAALAAGFAVHLRPDALPFAIVPVLLATLPSAPRARTPIRGLLPLATLVALVGWRVYTLPAAPPGLVRMPGLEALLPRAGEPAGAASFQLFLHAGFTPPVLWGLAALGAAAWWREGRGRALAVVLVWIVVATIPVAGKVFPLVDAIRLQLAGQAPWLLLAGVGAAALPRWALPAALLAFLPYYPLRPWVQTEEWRFLRATVPTLPEGTTVRYDPRPQRAHAFAGVMEALGPARWSPAAGDLVYVGLDCRARGGCDTSGCITETVTRLDGRVDLDLALTDRTIGFWRCPSDE